MPSKGMVQWAPGTKPQRFDRTGSMSYPESKFQQEQLEAMELMENRKRNYNFKAGDLVVVGEDIHRVSGINETTGAVMIGIYPHAPECITKLPEWFCEAFVKALEEARTNK